MNTTRITLPEFYVLGKEGVVTNTNDYINDLWQDVNKHFEEIAYIITWNEDGSMKGIWGIMTNEEGEFEVKEPNMKCNFLAGLECSKDAVAPVNWKKIKVPAFEYIKAEIETTESFKEIIGYLIANKIDIVGTIQNYTDPKTQKNYLMIPIKKI